MKRGLRNFGLCGALLACVFSAPVLALEPLSEMELEQVTGREGISLGLEIRVNTDANGNPLNSGDFTGCDTTTNFAATACRFALKYANRDAGGGEWIVAKNFYGILKMPAVYLDATRTPASGTSYTDLSRFEDASGSPLLASPNDLPAMQVSFPQTVDFALNLGGLTAEYGATGYLNNANAPFGGIQIGNSAPDTPAQIDFGGTMSVFGF